jgi:hypothetical protein
MSTLKAWRTFEDKGDMWEACERWHIHHYCGSYLPGVYPSYEAAQEAFSDIVAGWIATDGIPLPSEDAGDDDPWYVTERKYMDDYDICPVTLANALVHYEMSRENWDTAWHTIQVSVPRSKGKFSKLPGLAIDVNHLCKKVFGGCWQGSKLAGETVNV